MPLDFSIDRAAQIAGSQRKLAEQLGIQQAHLSEMKFGRRTCAVGMRVKIAKIAGHDPLKAIFEGLATKLDPSDEYEAQALVMINTLANAIPDPGQGQEKAPEAVKQRGLKTTGGEGGIRTHGTGKPYA